jgi:hypothetical protein
LTPIKRLCFRKAEVAARAVVELVMEPVETLSRHRVLARDVPAKICFLKIAPKIAIYLAGQPAGTSVEDLHASGAAFWFCREADRELGLNGALNRYWDANPKPSIESIPFLGPDNRPNFFDQQANSPLDCCFIDRASLSAEAGTAHLLVEYILKNSLQIEEADRQFIYLESRKLFARSLAEFKASHPTVSENEASLEALSEASAKMLKDLGIPHERLAEILKEGRVKWQAIPTSANLPHRYTLIHLPNYRALNGKFLKGMKKSSGNDLVRQIVENLKSRQKPEPVKADRPRVAPKVNYEAKVIKRNVTGGEDAIDLEYEMWKEELQKNKTNRDRGS